MHQSLVARFAWMAVLLATAGIAHAAPIVNLRTFQDTPDPIAATETLTYHLVVGNTSFSASAAGVQLTVPIPSGTDFISVSDASCNYDGANVVCSIGNLPANTDRTIDIELRVTAPGGTVLTSEAVVTSTTGGETPDAIEQNTSVLAGADLELAMSASPGTVVAGGQVTYSMTVTNAGPDAASSLRIEDTLPPNVTYVSSSGGGWSCGLSGGEVVCTNPGPLANGGASAVSIIAQVQSSISGTLTNSATLSAATPDGLPGDNTQIASVNVVAGADLRVTKSAAPSPMIGNAPATFTLAPRNFGPDAASTVSVTDTLPNGFTNIAASGTNWSCSADQPSRTVTCTRATMPSGATNDITVTATAPDDSVVPPGGMSASNTATIGSSVTSDPDLTNNSGSVTFPILRDGSDLSITATKSPNPVASGTALTTRIVVHNNGPRAVASGDTITVTTQLPTGEDYSGPGSFSTNGWSCTYVGATRTFTCTRTDGLTLGSNTPAIILVTTATDPTSLTSQVCTALGGAQPDPNNINDCVSTSSNSTAAHGNLRIVKSQSAPTVIASASTETYTLTISNQGPNDSANIVVTDIIPMQTGLAGGTAINAVAGTGSKGSTGSCSVSNATVTCNYASLLYEGGIPVDTAETAAITITVQRPMADGSFTNTADVYSSTVGDPDQSDNSSSVNTVVDPVADVEVQSKTVTPNPVLAGTDATYVITFHNAGPSTAQGVTLVDQFNPAGGDSGYTVRSITPSKGNCAFDAGTNRVSCTIGTLTAGEVGTVTLVVRPKWMSSPPAGRNLPNTATIATTTSDLNPANDSQGATLAISSAQVDLIANISDVASFSGVPPDPMGYDGITISNNIVTYRVLVTNAGPSEATTVRFQNAYTPPAGRSVTFVCDSDSPLACSGAPAVCTSTSATTVIGTPQTVSCNAPDLQAGGTYTRYLRYQINTAPAAAGDVYSNAVSVSSSETDSSGTNNSATEPTSVRAKADLQVTSKTAIGSTPLQYGEPFQWQIVVHNNGPGTAYQSVLADPLPANMELALNPSFTWNISPAGGTCSNSSASQFTCNLQDIPPGEDRTVTVNVFVRRPASNPPSSYVNTASVSTFSVDLVPANDSKQGSVSLVKSSVSGTVYTDDDNDGLIDATETGIGGVSLTLTGTDVFGNPVNRFATTNGAGVFIFDDLEQANGAGYTITQSQPAPEYEDGFETAGTAGSGAPPGGSVSATVGSNTITAIVLDKDQTATGYNFGELRNNTLSGTVFADVDGNGSKGASEPGIANVTLALTGTDARGAPVSRTATTNATGAYSFANVLPGSYQINETQPATYADGTDTAGSLGGLTTVNDQISAIPVAHADGTGYNFAEGPGSISGRVWRDANANAAPDAAEVGIAGVTISLTGTDALGAAVTRTTTTNATGVYSFPDLPAGTFTVTETQPAGFGSTTPDTISNILIGAAATSTGNDFGDSTGSLSGSVFFDRNANGVSDGTDTGIAGVTLTLSGTNAANAAVNLTTTTDASGNFSFTDLLAANASGYTLQETQPTAYANGQVTAGTAGGTPNQGLNRVTGIMLGAASNASGYRFAELGTVISGTVYRDVNRNAVLDPGDLGIGGTTISLRDVADVEIATTTTGADGTYSFPPQPAGSYTVVETQPPGYQSGPENASNSRALALVAGTPATVNFGESAGSLAGTVFLDGDNNGVQDPGELGLPGVTLTLSGTAADGSAVNRTASTNPSGQYVFADVLSGTYSITETQPAAFGDGTEVLGAGNAGGNVGNDVYSAIALPPGTQATGYNFAETGAAVIGVVFRDFNRDGAQQAGDQGIAGVTLTLRDASNAVVGTTTTAADGSYMFPGIPSGNYSVVESQPAGYGSAASSPDTLNVVVPAGGAASANFADTLSTLAGSVYIDLDGDGVRDAGEPGISAISVTLTGMDAASQAVNRTAATDSNGAFQFIDLLTPNVAGYTLAEPTQPAAYADGDDAAGTAGGNVTNDVISAIHIGVNTDATGYTFGELGTTISGVVFKDRNANGARETGDAGIGGVTITLKDAGGTVVRTTTTAADGTYSVSGLPAGNYTVDETQPAGYGSSTPESVSVTVAPGGSSTADFGETTSSLAGGVWADTNANGQRDAGEPGIANITVALSGTDAAGTPVSRSALTDATGSFSFDDLLGGTYSLSETQPATYADGTEIPGSAGGTVGNDVISAIALPPGTAVTGYFFGELGQAITGRVWLDSDRNGVPDANEAGIANVTITVRDSANTAVATTTSGADGSYGFANIPAGRYTVEETQPQGYGSSTPDTVTVDLTAGGVAPEVRFGETAGSLAGIVFNDADNDGTRDAGEPGIAGVALQLGGTDMRGNSVTLNAVTDATGQYRFADVVGGTYTLTETQPPEYQDGQDTSGSAGGTPNGSDAISAISLGAAIDATGYLFGEHGTVGSIAGSIWRDNDHDRMRGSGEPALAGWIAELYQGALLVQSTTTAADGAYRFDAVPPGSGYEVRFREPTSRALYGKPVTNERGLQIAPGAIGPNNPGGADPRGGTLLGVTLAPAGELNEQSLPLDPMGVVYDSVSRQPVSGATVTLIGPAGFDAETHLLGGSTNVQQITDTDGFYQYLLMPGAPAGVYSITVTPPPGRYTPGVSTLIPPCAGALTSGPTPAPAVVQSSAGAPAAQVLNIELASCATNTAQLAGTANTTQYFLSFALTPGISADVVNNHVPVDPILGGALIVTKTTPMLNVSVGDLVPYTISVTNTLDASLTNVDVRDLLPPGFAYRNGSASVSGVRLEPQRAGRQLTWTDQSFAPHERRIYKLVLVVGAGVSEGKYVNQAFALNSLVGATISNVATAAVRVVPDPVFDCPDLIGKVFDDRNANGYQDEGEPGIPNVRLATLNGVLVTTDAEGRFHVPCPAIPNAYRGSNFVMKLDVRTLPSGYRVTTENPRDVRLTRGKLVKLNFGATIHRVLRLEVTDEAFEPGTTNLKPEWRARVTDIPRLLQDKPSVIRLAYSPGDGNRDLAKRRKSALIEQIERQWRALQEAYPLQVEDEAEDAP